ncbi:Gfo/Idh/MocA family protein [Microlunatus speluncae]|uniref:Gfo/Idh/MocA family protein n=1 Tax=Microlunatus speluncae TaxID=2594267 RepID=UPI0012661BE7|nr:Gfo/Idh/MocA family oxidoreductase [Microlunatus speluncae]
MEPSRTNPAEGKTRYAVCGLSRRAIGMFVRPLLKPDGTAGRGDFADGGEIVALLDVDQARLAAFNDRERVDLPGFGPDQFDTMISETRPDAVIVTGPDGSHADYLVRALEHDLDVICEKPMVIDCEQAKAVLAAERTSRGTVRVTHNSRYREPHQVMRRMIKDGWLGRITNVEFVHNLDTYHGTSYFYRWNRYRDQSGGLTITKAVHHFDLINWLLGDVPDQVFAYGALNYYGKNGAHNPSIKDGVDYDHDEQRRRDPYYQRWHVPGGEVRDDHLSGRDALPYDVQYPPGSSLYIYDDDIEIEDTYSAVVRYRSGASMSYSLNLSAAWEGYVLAINGTEGRIETTHYTAPDRCPFPATDRQPITYLPLFGERQVHETRRLPGSHNGSDLQLRQDLFTRQGAAAPDPLGLRASSREGALAVAVGEAMWRSVRSGAPVDIAALLDA